MKDSDVDMCRLEERWSVLRIRLVCCLLIAATGCSAAAADKKPSVPKKRTISLHDVAETYPPAIQALLAQRAKQLSRVASRVSTPQGARVTRLDYVITVGSRWAPGHRLTVAFLGGSEELRAKIAEAAQQWTSLKDDNGLHPNVTLDFGTPPSFREWTTSDTDYAADVRIAFDTDVETDKGYWSAVGNDAVNADLHPPAQPSMMLYAFDQEPNDQPLRPYLRATVIHEFGHAFGFQHEHQSPKGGCDFRWDDEAGYVLTQDPNTQVVTRDPAGRSPSVYTYFGGPPNNWDHPLVDNNLRQLPDTSAFDTSRIDKRSIMKYKFDSMLFVTGEHSVCFFPYDNLTISQLDRAGFFKAYPAQASQVTDVLNERIRVLNTVIRASSEKTSTVPVELKTGFIEKRDTLMRMK